jgi:hypothetical protein
MASAATERLLSQKKARKRKERWPRKFKNLKIRCHEEVTEAARMAREKIDSTEEERSQLRERVEVLERNGPAVVEIVDVKSRSFFRRLWWALRFAFGRVLEFERK